MFKKNVGVLDMLVRLALTVVFFYVGFIDNPYITEPSSKMALGILGILPLLTGVFRTCPLYSLIGINTCAIAE